MSEVSQINFAGEINVLKSLVVSQLVYLLTPLKSNYSALTEINKLLYTFLWNGKGDKIKRNVIILIFFRSINLLKSRG